MRSGDMCTSSKTITNVRRCWGFGTGVLVETRDRVGEGAASNSGRTTASKLEMLWGLPSSTTVKSDCFRPGIGLPFLSRTTASTVTSSTPDGNWGAGEAGSCPWAARPIAAPTPTTPAPKTPQATFMRSPTPRFATLSWRSGRIKGRSLEPEPSHRQLRARAVPTPDADQVAPRPQGLGGNLEGEVLPPSRSDLPAPDGALVHQHPDGLPRRQTLGQGKARPEATGRGAVERDHDARALPDDGPTARPEQLLRLRPAVLQEDPVVEAHADRP